MTKVILLVEDNPTDAKLTIRAFQRCGVANQVVTVGDGAAALEHLAGHPLPTLVLLDLNLPKIGGLEVLRRLRADSRTRLVPVIILTSSVEEDDVVKSYTLGANAYVRKPVDFAEFVEAAKSGGLFWLLLNQSPFATGRSP